MPIDPAPMVLYTAAARARAEQKRQRVKARRERAWEFAHRAAEVLRRDFGARRVAAFGSVVRAGRFHPRSDVDLAAWGIPENAYLRAVASLLALGEGIPVDLIRAEEATEALLKELEREGVPL